MKLLRLLKDELARDAHLWVQEKIITKDQAQQILNLYGVDYTKSAEKTTAYSVLITLAYLFLGLALITILSANWDEIPRELRMGGLIAITLGINLLALYKYNSNEEASALLFFLGALSYGASIMLIAQIYHLGEHFPDGIYWWAVPTVALALLMQNNVLTFLGVGLGIIWFFSESSMGFYPANFPLFLLLLWWATLRHKQNVIIFILAIFCSAIWLEYSLAWQIGGFSEFYLGIEHFIFSGGIFIAFYGISHLMMVSKKSRIIDYGMVLNLWVIRFLLLSAFILSFSEPWSDLITAKWKQPLEVLFLSVSLTGLSIFLTFKSRYNIIPVSIFSVLLLTIGISLFITDDREFKIYYQVADNIVLFLLSIWFIKKGISESLSHYFFMGISSILVLALLRYMDLIGDYIGAAILFSVFAFILLGAARYWKKHHLALHGRSKNV